MVPKSLLQLRVKNNSSAPRTRHLAATTKNDREKRSWSVLNNRGTGTQ